MTGVKSIPRSQSADPYSPLRTAVVLFFGAIPALFPAYLAVLLGGLVLANVTKDPTSIVLAIWPAAGLYGVVALWLAAFGKTSRVVAVGLLAGILAILPWSVLLSGQPHSDFWYNFSFLSPCATAGVILFQLIRAGVFSRDRKRQFGNNKRDLAWVLFAGCLLGILLAAVSIDVRPAQQW